MSPDELDRIVDELQQEFDKDLAFGNKVRSEINILRELDWTSERERITQILDTLSEHHGLYMMRNSVNQGRLLDELVTVNEQLIDADNADLRNRLRNVEQELHYLRLDRFGRWILGLIIGAVLSGFIILSMDIFGV